jgi:hypothetical protein
VNRAVPELPLELWSSLRALAPEPDRFVALLREHRLLPFAANDPHFDGGTLPAVQEAWRQVRDGDDAQSAAYDEELDELVALLDPDDYVFIKGAAFRRTIYPDPTLRPMNDIDIVVRKERAASIAGLLRASGYGPAAQSHLYFVRPPRNLFVEIITVFTQETRHALDYESIFGERTRVLGAPHLATHHALATHALYVGTSIHVHARKFLDLWLLSRSPDVVERAVETAVRWKMRRSFHAAMCLLAQLLPESAAPLKEMSGRTLKRSERRLVEQFIVPRRALTAGAWRAWVLGKRLALLESNAIRARFVASWVRDAVTR